MPKKRKIENQIYEEVKIEKKIDFVILKKNVGDYKEGDKIPRESIPNEEDWKAREII